MIVCCGYLNLDLLVQVPALPGDGERVQATALRRQPGGMAANVAAAAAAQGAEVAFVGAVGDDRDGDVLVADLAARGIDTRHVHRDRRTTTCLVLVTPSGQRAIVSEDDALEDDDLAGAAALAAVGDGILVLDGYRWPRAEQVLADAGPAGRPLVVTDLDGCRTRAGLDAAARSADHLVCSSEHLARLVEPVAADRAAATLAEEHGCTVVLTLGADGWVAFAGGRVHRGAGHAVDVVDTTGAGDAFCGAYVAALQRGLAVDAAAALANAAAALSTTGHGARDGLVDRGRAERLLAGTG